MPDESHAEEIIDSELSQLKALQEESEGFLKRRVTLWGIRWTIGFALIWGAVTYEPAWNWLWWAGAGLAVLSLTAILVGRALLNRKFAQVEAKAAEARAAAQLAEAEDET